MLSESELLRGLLDQTSAMLAYWDAAQHCRFASRAYGQWYGVSSESLVGKHMRELLGPCYPIDLSCIEKVLCGEPQELERGAPGEASRIALVQYVPDRAGSVVRGFFVFLTDISALQGLALRRAAQRFRPIIEAAPLGMALVGPDHRFVQVNRALCEIVGYEADELIGLTLPAITHPEDLESDRGLADQLARGEIRRYQSEKRYLRKDGTTVDIVLSVSVLQGPDGAPLCSIAQVEDVTERKRLEERLRLAEAKSSGILSISADAIISVDEQQRITMFNEGAEKIFGYTKAEVMGAPLDLLIPERFRSPHRQHVNVFGTGRQSARHMGERTRVIFGLRKNGEEFPADAAISKLEVEGKRVLTVALRDITEQKRLENEQKLLADVGPVLATLDHEKTLTRIAELAVRDFADLCIVDVVVDDLEIRRLTVVSRETSKAWLCELLARVPLDRSRPHLLRSVLETRQPVFLQHPSGEMIASLAQSEEHLRALREADIHSMVAVPLLAHARLLGGIAFISSTASRVYGPGDVRLAEELAQRAALAIENARLYGEARRATQVRDDVLGIVAHDLRNPLATIRMQANLLRHHAEQEPKNRSQRPADAIERAATRMNRLIEDLLDVTRMEANRLSVEPAALPARQVVSDSVEAQEPLAAAASIDLGLELAPELPEVWADRDRLVQVFENLIGNALKFTPGGGRITVGAAPREEEVLFWVADTGSGIAAADVPHLFDRFWQARKAQRGGAGLGLPIVKGIVEAHRGRVWVESTPGKGSSFFFTIPTAQRAQAGQADPSRQGS